jgi:hypothetical protein
VSSPLRAICGEYAEYVLSESWMGGSQMIVQEVSCAIHNVQYAMSNKQATISTLQGGIVKTFPGYRSELIRKEQVTRSEERGARKHTGIASEEFYRN